MTRRATPLILLAAGLPIILCAGIVAALWFSAPAAPLASQPVPVNPTSGSQRPPSSASTDEAMRIALYNQTAPAVVVIEALLVDPGDTTTPAQQRGLGQGSGFVFDADGHIVTNNHVVDGASYFEITFNDNHRASATLVAIDLDSDLAVLKVDPASIAGITPLKLGDSHALQVGQTAIAIGSPFGQRNTMTVGIISALKGRELAGRLTPGVGSFRNTNIIQTDAAINPGNSGGPLLNTAGDVVGVNTSISISQQSLTSTFEGVGYAVPSSTVAIVVPDLIVSGAHEYAYLGVGMNDVTPLLAETYDLPVQQGALIVAVQPDTPAAEAKLRAGDREATFQGLLLTLGGDIITAINSVPVYESSDLLSVINESRVGDTVTLTVQRGRQQLEIKVVLGRRP